MGAGFGNGSDYVGAVFGLTALELNFQSFVACYRHWNFFDHFRSPQYDALPAIVRSDPIKTAFVAARQRKNGRRFADNR